MSEVSIITALCPRCNGDRKCTVHGNVEKSWYIDEQSISGGDQYRLLECRGCETVFMHIKSHNSESIQHGWRDGEETYEYEYEYRTLPAVEEETDKPDWVWDLNTKDPQLYQIMNEVYTAAKNDSFILAAIGLRTAFDRTTEILQIHPSLPLIEKVKQLKNDGVIGDAEAQILSDVTNAGSGAAHRGWSPKSDEFQSLLHAIESFIHRTVILERSLSHIAKNVPQKQTLPKKV
ncbi:TPA: DUF4145 domain-containing protein [Citrobacter freundii]|uniref:DUF4145 domain-containing protein n=1 Tax=Citrobacter freundii TaxID=546 RepID=UPI0015851D5A|nr:DUF4145 domain-containing protein [Citrobacter freundii]MDV1858733.1 DUF4145 domain-containing protein [Citrobacter freundii]MEB0419927.1 DUF4145 domain-containing protein [Citrobacter freundii]NUN39509.1 DUF4145 domain-containing protein [Citrobacter freundii]HAT7555650.1 DUF4145 domain-containing protein [Citrobacter freundii]HCB1464071.1 DUF4145 domain-containing protein [Citrobacter freundii]